MSEQELSLSFFKSAFVHVHRKGDASQMRQVEEDFKVYAASNMRPDYVLDHLDRLDRRAKRAIGAQQKDARLATGRRLLILHQGACAMANA